MGTQVPDEGYAARAETWARGMAQRPALCTEAEVANEIGALHAAGLLSLPARGPDFHRELLEALSWIGFGSLPLGRLIEGHLNALMLVSRFGTEQQLRSAQELAQQGGLFGVWNTGEAEPVRLAEEGEGWSMRGRKTFGSGAALVQRPIVTADLPGRGWQMTLVPMDTATLSIDRSSWRPFGMEASFSFDIDFTGTALAQHDLIGEPDAFYREPAFSGGAVRFAAVHAGGAHRLLHDFTAWLKGKSRASDPHQLMRLSHCVQSVTGMQLWVQHAAKCSAAYFDRDDEESARSMVHAADMVRTVVERETAEVMRLVTVGVGAHGLLQPNTFGPVLRDLTMYLRQPAPDRIAMRIAEAHLQHGTRATCS